MICSLEPTLLFCFVFKIYFKADMTAISEVEQTALMVFLCFSGGICFLRAQFG